MGATLNGMIEANGSTTSAFFDLGPDGVNYTEIIANPATVPAGNPLGILAACLA